MILKPVIYDEVELERLQRKHDPNNKHENRLGVEFGRCSYCRARLKRVDRFNFHCNACGRNFQKRVVGDKRPPAVQVPGLTGELRWVRKGVSERIF